MSLMDRTPFNNSPQNVEQLVQRIRQNPQAFEEQLKQTNPQAYQMALNIRNSQNPQAVIMQMVQQRGLNPNILNMFGLK